MPAPAQQPHFCPPDSTHRGRVTPSDGCPAERGWLPRGPASETQSRQRRARPHGTRGASRRPVDLNPEHRLISECGKQPGAPQGVSWDQRPDQNPGQPLIDRHPPSLSFPVWALQHFHVFHMRRRGRCWSLHFRNEDVEAHSGMGRARAWI